MSDLVLKEDTNLLQEDAQDLVEMSDSVAEAFRLPERNWNLIIRDYNSKTDKKFPYSPLECKVILEHVKRGQIPKIIFQGLGTSIQKYTFLVQRAEYLEEEIERLRAKESLTEDEVTALHNAQRNPIRILMGDVKRAEALCSLSEWEKFNEFAANQPDMKAMQMKAKYKEIFGESQRESGGYNVQIQIGGDWLDSL